MAQDPNINLFLIVIIDWMAQSGCIYAAESRFGLGWAIVWNDTRDVGSTIRTFCKNFNMLESRG